MKAFIPKRDDYLQELLRKDGRGRATQAAGVVVLMYHVQVLNMGAIAKCTGCASDALRTPGAMEGGPGAGL